MKRLLIIITVLVLMAGISFADSEYAYHQNELTGTLAASGTAIIGKMNLDNMNIDGFYSIQLEVTGDGTLKVEYMVSNDFNTTGLAPLDADFVKPSSASDIVTAHTKTTGTSGLDFYQFPTAGDPILAGWLAYRVTETGGANTVTYSIKDKQR